MCDERVLPEDRLLYSIKTAAKAVDVSYKTMQRMIDKRVIGYRLLDMGTPGSVRKRIHREDIDEWIAKGSIKPPI